jgi:chemotaxis protein MotB
MSFAAAKQLVPPLGGGVSAGDSAGLPWEAGVDDSLARQETWLLSFIDILALLLTLFVLLLAYQDYRPEPGATGAGLPVPQAAEFDLSLFTFHPGEILHRDFGHSGAGLLPLAGKDGYPVGNETEDLPAGSAASIESVSKEPLIGELPEEVSTAVNQVAAQQEEDASTLQAETLEDSEQVESRSVVLAVEERIAQPLEIEGPALPTPTEVIHQAFSQSPLQQHVDLLNRTGAVSVEISGNILFGLASAALSPEGRQLLNELAAVLGTLPYELSVEGHTDNVPISSSRFPSNWELSSARAAVATRALIEQGIAADRLRAIGYGDTRPLTDNLAPEGRAKNRRVSFVLHVEEQLTD